MFLGSLGTPNVKTEGFKANVGSKALETYLSCKGF